MHMRRVCYLFPGQGAQYIGMGKDLYDNCLVSKEIFDIAEKVLPDVGIKRLCFEGPIEELTQTANSQVCILVASMAALKAIGYRLKAEGQKLDVVACAGLSLGELTSLVAAGSIEFQDAVRLVRRRGELMEEASKKNPGSMASIIGLSYDNLKNICNGGGAEIANLNCPGQIVISGTNLSVQATMELATKNGAKKAIPLKVSGPFHSSLMKEAAELFRLELEKVKFQAPKPKIEVFSNVTANAEKTSEEIKDNLVKQLCSSVRWEESIRNIAALGVDTFLEIGPGKVLKGLLRRIDSSLKVYNIEKLEDVNTVISYTEAA